MSFHPCIVIPVYEHAAALREFLPRVIVFGYPIYLVDDGSSSADAEIIDALAREHSLKLLRLGTNQGKGAAVLTAFREALSAGFSHALQIDADGQHDAQDIPLFLAAAEAAPSALILSHPSFDESAPWERVWGRKLTTGVLWLETWSTAVRDGLCGYRVYPLAATIAIDDRSPLQRRMGFDPEIIVRMMWSGVPVRNIRTRVNYPRTGVSHFHYFSDNIQLVCLHTRLIAEALFRLPRRLLQWANGHSSREAWYEKKEHGNLLGLRFLLTAYELGGRRLLEIILFPVVLYFYLKDGTARRASRNYLGRVAKLAGSKKCSPDFRLEYEHLYRFAQSLILSLQAWRGDLRAQNIRWRNAEIVYQLLDQGKGALVLGAHFGCLETCRAVQLERKGLRVTPLMYVQNSENFRRFLKEINPRAGFEFIPIERMHAGVAMDISRRIAAGEFVAILADRLAPKTPERSLKVGFLGGEAHLPEGAFALAYALDCPVLTLFSAYDAKLNQSEAYWDVLEVQRGGREKRDELLQQLAQKFADRLAEMCLRYPLQWFNFYDFWQEPLSSYRNKARAVRKPLAEQPPLNL